MFIKGVRVVVRRYSVKETINHVEPRERSIKIQRFNNLQKHHWPTSASEKTKWRIEMGTMNNIKIQNQAFSIGA